MKYKHFEKSQKMVKTSWLLVLLREKILQVDKGSLSCLLFSQRQMAQKNKSVNESKFILIHQNWDILPKQKRIRKLKKTKTVVGIQKGKCNTTMCKIVHHHTNSFYMVWLRWDLPVFAIYEKTSPVSMQLNRNITKQTHPYSNLLMFMSYDYALLFLKWADTISNRNQVIMLCS